ncbi:MAG: Holliday junction resolvase RuvX [Porticoccaceae bacterium]
MQLLAFDFGLSQIGLATGNTRTDMASELTVVSAKNGKPNWDEIQEIVREWQPGLCLVGLPINMDGTESELSRHARKFARQIEGRFGLKTVMVDERLSSFEAKEWGARKVIKVITNPLP